MTSSPTGYGPIDPFQAPASVALSAATWSSTIPATAHDPNGSVAASSP